MGFIDKWIAQFLNKKVAPKKSASQIEQKTTQTKSHKKQFTSNQIDTSHPVNDSKGMKKKTVNLSKKEKGDLLLVLCRERFIFSKTAKNFIQSVFFQQVIRNLDQIGRQRAADQLLADALLIFPSHQIKLKLSKRLLDRGQRLQAKSLLTDLSHTEQYAFYAFKNLAGIFDSMGKTEQACMYYERALAIDFSDQVLQDKIREHHQIS